ncbi:FHA domain-containing protein [Olsenella sp. KGMB02461]|nr:FHA domain-containing protein [Olsenella sp. KGMB02461]
MSTALLPSPVSSAPPEASLSTKTCPHCGSLLFSDMDVCYRCFHRVDTPTPPQPDAFASEGSRGDPFFDARESIGHLASEPLDDLPHYEGPFAAEKPAPSYSGSPPWEEDMSSWLDSVYGCSDPSGCRESGLSRPDGSYLAYEEPSTENPHVKSLSFFGVDPAEDDACLPYEYGGKWPFSPEDAEVDEADETRDLTAISESISYGLHLNWRGLEVTIPIPAQGLTLGRASSCDVVLRSAAISRRHVQIVVEDGMVLVADLGSVNQALLDDKPVEVCEPWLPGSVLNLCGAQFSLIMLDPRE